MAAVMALALGVVGLGYVVNRQAADTSNEIKIIPSDITAVPPGQIPNTPNIYSDRDTNNDMNIERQHLDLERQAQNLSSTDFTPSVLTSSKVHQDGEDYALFANNNYLHGLTTRKETQPTQKEAFSNKLRMFTGDERNYFARTVKNIENLNLPTNVSEITRREYHPFIDRTRDLVTDIQNGVAPIVQKLQPKLIAGAGAVGNAYEQFDNLMFRVHEKTIDELRTPLRRRVDNFQRMVGSGRTDNTENTADIGQMIVPKIGKLFAGVGDRNPHSQYSYEHTVNSALPADATANNTIRENIGRLPAAGMNLPQHQVYAQQNFKDHRQKKNNELETFLVGAPSRQEAKGFANVTADTGRTQNLNKVYKDGYTPVPVNVGNAGYGYPNVQFQRLKNPTHVQRDAYAHEIRGNQRPVFDAMETRVERKHPAKDTLFRDVYETQYRNNPLVAFQV